MAKWHFITKTIGQFVQFHFQIDEIILSISEIYALLFHNSVHSIVLL